MDAHLKLLDGNRDWIRDRLAEDPEYFHRLAAEQRPTFMWIGCSDSRVPAEEVTGTRPGELFVHRNIANLVVATDFNLMSVLQYAVDVLQVRHLIVCGHYGCGGVRAALSQQRFGLLNKWLSPIKDVYARHTEELERLEGEARSDRLVELNVIEQVQNLLKTSIVQRAWHTAHRPRVHGWVYGLSTGLLEELVLVEPGTPLAGIYQYDLSSEPQAVD